jgi:hypothetical protein
MAAYISSATAVFPTWAAEELALFRWTSILRGWGASMARQRKDRLSQLQSAQCSLCGIVLPIGMMVPDGGQACADIRWYCKDAKSCTERWTAGLPGTGHVAPAPSVSELRAGAVPDPMPADDLVPAKLLGIADEA